MGATAIEWTGSPLTRALVLRRALRLEGDVTLEAGTYPAGHVLPGFTFNGWKGCEKLSPACKHCYAESWAKRCGYTPDGKHHLTLWGPAATTPRERTSAEYWKRPLRWNRIAAELGVRLKVFAFSLADVGEDHPMVGPWREEFFGLIDRTPDLTWLLLTKRPAHLASVWPKAWSGRANLPRNVWVGTTAEDQHYAAERVPALVEINAAEHFLSLELLLGPIDLACDVGQWETNIGDFPRRLWDCPRCCGTGYFQVDPYVVACSRCALSAQAMKGTGVGVSWVIIGGESGGGCRAMDLRALDSIAKRCVAAHVPVFVKQDSGLHPGMQGRLPADLWALKQWPQSGAA